MVTTTAMQFEPLDVCQLIETIWPVLFDCEVHARCQDGNPLGTSSELTASIPISGAWNGMVALQCPVGLGQQAASVMFDIEPERVTAAHVRDAVGELTNIISGNFKTLLPEGSQLGLPSVGEGAGDILGCPGDRVLARVAVQTPGFEFHVLVLGSA